MSCPVDSYYTTDQVNNSSDACGDCACADNESCTGHGPGDCPNGQYATGRRTTPCGECTYAGVVIGHRKICRWSQPNMDVQSQINCCLDQNLPGNSPNGYCASGWCPGSDNCVSFLTQYCQKNNLQTNTCKQFCRNNIGKCDPALISYCSDQNNYTTGVCGCALPPSQYLLSSLKTPNGEAVPISCDQRCGVAPDAIRLQGQQDCKIGAICVAEFNDVAIVEQETGYNPAIQVIQNCGVTPGPNGPPIPSSNTFIQRLENFASTTSGKIIIFLIVLFIIILIVVLIWLLSSGGSDTPVAQQTTTTIAT